MFLKYSLGYSSIGHSSSDLLKNYTRRPTRRENILSTIIEQFNASVTDFENKVTVVVGNDYDYFSIVLNIINHCQ